MKIAILFINIGAYHASRIRAAAQLFEKNGWELTTIQLTDDTLEHPWGDFCENLGVELKTLIPINSPLYKSSSDVFSSLGDQELIRYLNQSVPDVIAIPGWSFSLARSALKWCRRKNKIAVLLSESKEDDELRQFWKEMIKSCLVKQYQSALVGGKPHQRYLLKLGLPQEAIFTGYDTVENDTFHPSKIRFLSSPQKQTFFLAINRLIEKKNIPFLINAYAQYREQTQVPPWHLVLCGDGPLRSQIEQQICDLGIQDGVKLTGFLQQQQLLPYFAQASCFIHASKTEQWGLVINEAMAAALPLLISNRCGCYEDLILEGVNGYSFDPDNCQQLTDLMVRITSGKIDLNKMGMASLTHIQNFSPDYFANGLMQAVQYALAHQK